MQLCTNLIDILRNSLGLQTAVSIFFLRFKMKTTCMTLLQPDLEVLSFQYVVSYLILYLSTSSDQNTILIDMVRK